MNYKVIILDFDGVLVESTAIKDEAFDNIFKDFPEFKDEIDRYLQDNQGLIRFKKFRHVYEQILKKPYTDVIERKLGEQFSSFVIDRVIKCPQVAGAEDFLNHFYRKIPLYIVSVNPPEDLNTILTGRRWTRYFKRVYAVSDGKAQAIGEIVKTEGIDINEAIFIGDSLSDLKDARAVKVPFIGREKKDTFKGRAVRTVQDLAEALDEIKSGF